tara:strand:- start:867 stop:998 length:132 start_codon:yes stop_codon:yes gene_type:complete
MNLEIAGSSHNLGDWEYPGTVFGVIKLFSYLVILLHVPDPFSN